MKKINPDYLLKTILNKLFILTTGFYVALIAGSIVNLNQTVLEALKTGGTLSLGAFIAISKDNTDDNDKSPNPEDEFYGHRP